MIQSPNHHMFSFHIISSDSVPRKNRGKSEQHGNTICGKENPLWTLPINSFSCMGHIPLELLFALIHLGRCLDIIKGKTKRSLPMVENCNVNGVLPLFPLQPKQHLYHTFKTSKFQPNRFSSDSKTATFQWIKNKIPLKATITKPSLK